MKQIYDFDRYPPPVLNENMLRDKLEKRSKKRQIILLAAGGVLLQITALLLGVLTSSLYPMLSVCCLVYQLVSMSGGGVIAVIYAQKGGNFHHE